LCIAPPAARSWPVSPQDPNFTEKPIKMKFECVP
jgi:hypothetical protein